MRSRSPAKPPGSCHRRLTPDRVKPSLAGHLTTQVRLPVTSGIRKEESRKGAGPASRKPPASKGAVPPPSEVVDNKPSYTGRLAGGLEKRKYTGSSVYCCYRRSNKCDYLPSIEDGDTVSPTGLNTWASVFFLSHVCTSQGPLVPSSPWCFSARPSPLITSRLK